MPESFKANEANSVHSAELGTVTRSGLFYFIITGSASVQLSLVYTEIVPLGRPRKYPIDTLQLGERVAIPFEFDNNDQPTNKMKIYEAVRYEMRKRKKKFKFAATREYALVTRIK